ncbi:MAG TPA: S8 family serine peptidase [Gaiellaceae bacterium]|nr:S8 family serine peptidase [Gaiellaceae bacterium]
MISGRLLLAVAVLAAIACGPAAAAPQAQLAASEHALVAVEAGAPGVEPLLRRAGGRPLSPELGLWLLRGRDAARVVAPLERMGALRFAERSRRRDAAVRFTDPLATPGVAYHFALIGADRAEPPGPGFPITVLDSGIDLGNPDFAGRADTFTLNPQAVASTEPEEYHGTEIAAVAAAPVNAFGAEGVYPAAVVRSYDLGGDFTDAAIIVAIRAAVAAGPSVINISLAGPGESRALCEEIARAVGLGSLVVASSGNDLRAGNPVNYPAACPHVLTVGSVDRAGSPSSFSSANAAVDLVAPGERLPVALPDGSGRLVSGTSFAAPVVAAVAAWVRTVRGAMHHTQLFDLMRSSARDVAQPGFDVRTGFGIVDVPRALAAPLPSVDPQEPNDDVRHVVANGLFPRAKPLVSARFRARLDFTEDPDDVYRVSVPPNRQLTVTVTPDDDVRVALYAPTARTVLRPHGLLALSDRPGRSAERVAWANRTKRGVVVFLHVTTTPRAVTGTPLYTVTLARGPLPRR